MGIATPSLQQAEVGRIWRFSRCGAYEASKHRHLAIPGLQTEHLQDGSPVTAEGYAVYVEHFPLGLSSQPTALRPPACA